jgi:hypothetical protein
MGKMTNGTKETASFPPWIPDVERETVQRETSPASVPTGQNCRSRDMIKPVYLSSTIVGMEALLLQEPMDTKFE